jgi:hypothetical protein
MAARLRDRQHALVDPTLSEDILVGQGTAIRGEAPNGLDWPTYDVDENRIDRFSEDDFVRSQSACDGAPEL